MISPENVVHVVGSGTVTVVDVLDVVTRRLPRWRGPPLRKHSAHILPEGAF